MQFCGLLSPGFFAPILKPGLEAIRSPGSMNHLFVEYMFRMGHQSTHRILQFDKHILKLGQIPSPSPQITFIIFAIIISALVGVDVGVVESNLSAVSSRLRPPVDFHYNQGPRSHKSTFKVLGTPKSSTPCPDPYNQEFENHHSTVAMPKIPPTNPT